MSVSRRAFLRRGLGLVGLALAGSLPLAACGRTYPAPVGGLRFFTGKEWAVLNAAGGSLWPEGPAPGQLGAVGAGTAIFADRLIARANPRLQRDLHQLLELLEDMPWVVGHWRRFTDMSEGERADMLAALRTSPIGALRQAYTGLLRLTGMLTYMQPATWAGIGYPGPCIGRVNFGLGLDNKDDMPEPVNPNVFAPFARGAVA